MKKNYATGVASGVAGALAVAGTVAMATADQPAGSGCWVESIALTTAQKGALDAALGEDVNYISVMELDAAGQAQFGATHLCVCTANYLCA